MVVARVEVPRTVKSAVAVVVASEVRPVVVKRVALVVARVEVPVTIVLLANVLSPAKVCVVVETMPFAVVLANADEASSRPFQYRTPPRL